jgi:hypothetical protein
MRGDHEVGLALAITHLVAVGVLLAALAAPHGSGWSDILPFSFLTFLDLPLSLIPIFLPQRGSRRLRERREALTMKASSNHALSPTRPGVAWSLVNQRGLWTEI